ncbi:hypothetical protein [Nocardia brasiliensis]|uniref:hypothetical protein n=1 Tax=Nocardia brasiliensis TaxID=37326 RepID=UPI0024549F67|nr:hypothetical protein [Nocardia brasiliensis]
MGEAESGRSCRTGLLLVWGTTVADLCSGAGGFGQQLPFPGHPAQFGGARTFRHIQGGEDGADALSGSRRGYAQLFGYRGRIERSRSGEPDEHTHVLICESHTGVRYRIEAVILEIQIARHGVGRQHAPRTGRPHRAEHVPVIAHKQKLLINVLEARFYCHFRDPQVADRFEFGDDVGVFLALHGRFPLCVSLQEVYLAGLEHHSLARRRIPADMFMIHVARLWQLGEQTPRACCPRHSGRAAVERSHSVGQRDNPLFHGLLIRIRVAGRAQFAGDILVCLGRQAGAEPRNPGQEVDLARTE